MNIKNKVLIYRPGTIGDLVNTFGVIELIISKYDNKRVTLLNPNFDNAFTLLEESSEFFGEINQEYIKVSFFDFLKKFKIKGVQKVIFIPPRNHNIIKKLAWILRAQVSLLLNLKFPHIPLRWLFLTKNKENCFSEIDRLDYLFPGSRKLFLEKTLPKIRACVSSEYYKEMFGNFLTFSVGAKYSSKVWPQELCEAFIRDYIKEGKKIVINGEETNLLFNSLKAIFENYELVEIITTSTFFDYLCLISASEAVLTFDSGPAHMASLIDTPLFIITSDRDRANWTPIKFFRNFRSTISCGNCKVNDCKLDNICMRKIQPTYVKQVILDSIIE